MKHDEKETTMCFLFLHKYNMKSLLTRQIFSKARFEQQQAKSNSHLKLYLLMSNVIILNRDKKNRGYSSGKRIFKLNAAAKKKPRRHNTEVSI